MQPRSHLIRGSSTDRQHTRADVHTQGRACLLHDRLPEVHLVARRLKNRSPQELSGVGTERARAIPCAARATAMATHPLANCSHSTGGAHGNRCAVVRARPRWYCLRTHGLTRDGNSSCRARFPRPCCRQGCSGRLAGIRPRCNNRSHQLAIGAGSTAPPTGRWPRWV